MTASATTATATIPYRSVSGNSGGDIAAAFGWTVVLLLVATGIALLARRLGWLQRWGAVTATAAGERLRVEQALRVSPRTMLFRIGDGRRQYLLAESRDGLQLLELAAPVDVDRPAAAQESPDAG